MLAAVTGKLGKQHQHAVEQLIDLLRRELVQHANGHRMTGKHQRQRNGTAIAADSAPPPTVSG